MSKAAQIKTLLKAIVGVPSMTFPAIVLAVDEEKATVDVLPVGSDAELFDVRLKAAVDDQTDGLVIFPEVGSSVLVSLIGNDDNEAYVSSFSKVTGLKLKINGVKFEVNAEGMVLVKENESLRKLMTDLMNTIQALVWQTNMGPTIGLIPFSVNALEQLKTRTENLLKNGS